MLNEFICKNCHQYYRESIKQCPNCNRSLIYEGPEKNIIDRIQPDCLIHRYDGSDMLEPAVFLKPGKVNAKVATKLSEYAKPIIVPKHKIYAFQPDLWAAVQALRHERAEIMKNYDEKIKIHWQKLQPFPSL